MGKGLGLSVSLLIAVHYERVYAQIDLRDANFTHFTLSDD